ncbi:MAG TPA: DUF362 domain-containing protein [Candidatus Lokiarchaeia archaeon]|nr:DUF362 domain-containing protein [Candidatus Lokiarchaeia archaeon]
MTNSIVFVKHIEGRMIDNVRACFDQFGGAAKICKGKVFIKFNGTGPDKRIVTDAEVVLATVDIVKDVVPAKDIYVMENCAVGYPTRAVFEVNKLGKKVRQRGANTLFLDEQKPVLVEFHGEALDKPIPVPEILYENLVTHKEENTYINLPKLKAYTNCGVTLSIKNQHGLLYAAEKVYHHHLIDEKIVEILGMFRPDFNIIDGITAMNFGPSVISKEFVQPMGLLICGDDPVAVDTIGAKILGISDVRHINMAAERGLGINDENEITVLPGSEIIDKFKVNFDHDVDHIPLDIHPLVKIFRGTEKACKTGCKALDGSMRGLNKNMKFRPFALVYGKGHDTTELDAHPGPFFVNGPCAHDELVQYFDERQKKEGIEVIYTTECADLVQIYHGIFKASKINAFLAKWMALGMNPMKISMLARTARRNGGNFMLI